MHIDVIIPAFNEEESIARVLQSIPEDCVRRMIVVNNNSTDATDQKAKNAGAYVVNESRLGYGSACLRGMLECPDADIVVFLDADFSDDPAALPQLIEPVINNRADLVIGSRVLGKREKGALPIHAHFGNILACWLIRIFFGVRFTDLGPFRAIRRTSLDVLTMQDTDFGWTVEMQAKAAIQGLRCCEIPVPYRKRIGRSKISGTLTGSIKAGIKILSTIFLLFFKKHMIGIKPS